MSYLCPYTELWPHWASQGSFQQDRLGLSHANSVEWNYSNISHIYQIPIHCRWTDQHESAICSVNWFFQSNQTCCYKGNVTRWIWLCKEEAISFGQCEESSTMCLLCANTINNPVARWPQTAQGYFIVTNMVGNRLLSRMVQDGGFLVKKKKKKSFICHKIILRQVSSIFTPEYDLGFSIITLQWFKLVTKVSVLLLHYIYHKKPLIVSMFKVFMSLVTCVRSWAWFSLAHNCIHSQ